MWTRRSMLLSAAASLGVLGSGLAFAAAPTDKRLLVVLLRGGLDGLAAVPAIGDPDYRSARGGAAQAETAIALDSTFGLHPALAPLLPLYKQRELALVHAAALPYEGRSHFDAQDLLEHGSPDGSASHSGWLNRALHSLGEPSVPMAVGRQVPLLLRGPAKSTSADPTRTLKADDSFLDAVAELYADDPLLGPSYLEGLRAQAMLESYREGAAGRPGRKGAELDDKAAHVVGQLLASKHGPRVAVASIGGWDTHTRQQATLNRQLGDLADGLLALKEGLGDAWSETVIVAVSEFGRMVKGNGTSGTDHGTGGVMFLLGGAVRGGRVHGQWPGLAERDLLEGRDLRPTTDVRAVFKGVLAQHLGVGEGALHDTVFPESTDIEPLGRLVG